MVERDILLLNIYRQYIKQYCGENTIKSLDSMVDTQLTDMVLSAKDSEQFDKLRNRIKETAVLN